ncbi:hypothetical protein CI109_100779 [Kwoniella shandongensis]|uniref:Uncharacterized protein n=1 Tax=Kwoniella shandongensis TaxID=1734106 RepID=A0A5M6BXL7_9TREE|nr:uncharacterized protein CI109_005042 [Kwoniella shandongensis]KAA5526652.1 hypothetical protein CI109_005042 [Kwoniella shandongensis]
MFNSPSTRATPRRGGSRLRDTASVRSSSIRPQTPSLFSEPSHPYQPVTTTTPSVRSSRLALVSQKERAGSPTSSAGETVRTTRGGLEDGYDKDRVFWSRDERHVVSSLGGLPKEVAALIKGSDLVVNTVAGHVDPKSGFAMVSTPKRCIAWNYLKPTHSSPTTYTFLAPPTDHPHGNNVDPPVLSALYTGSTSSEPGMILVSPSGTIRFWESMSLALTANSERYQELYIDLGEDDVVERIWKLDGNNFVLTTVTSLAFRLTISPAGGRLVPTITALTRPGGMFGRATNAIFNTREDRTGISSVASAAGYVYIMAQRMIQKWAFGPDGQKLVQEYDLHEAVGSSLFEQWSSGTVSLELNDIVTLGQDELAVLVSYIEQEPGTSGYPRLHNSHAIVVFSFHPKSQTLMVARTVYVSYLAHSDPRNLDVPRLLVPPGSSMAFIRFAEVILLISLDDDAPYEEAITLKDAGRNAFIGAGTIRASAISKRSLANPSIVAIPASGGLMSIEALEPSVPSDTLNRLSSATARLKSRLEQAVFFGERSDNPLSFDLPAGFQGYAAEAAEVVSAEIVASTSPYMPAIFELRPHLSDRLLRLKELMAYIRSNGLLTILPQATRRRLSRDAEKITSAIDLWDYQNRLMDQIHSRTPASLFSDSIHAYMTQANIFDEEDYVRLFFRTQVQNLDRLLEVVFATFREAVAAADRADIASWVLEANKVFLYVVRTAAQYREAEQGLYEVDRERPAIELWTARDSLIDALDFLYSTTEQLIKERSRDLGSVIDESPSENGAPQLRHEQQVQTQLKSQMANLAAALCTNMEDKCRATSRRQLEDGADEQEGIKLGEKWIAMKPRVIRPLVGIDRVSEAYALAEHHNDFLTLVVLCHDPVAGAGPARLQSYIERFGEEFAFVLYQWYIDQGQLHVLLTQDEVYGSLVTRFFELHGYPELAWMHHIACKRYGQAAGALSSVLTSGQTNKVEQQHLVGSIAKLAAVAEIRSRGDSEGRKQLLISLDDELDLVNLQNALRESLLPETGRSRTPAKSALEQQITLLVDRPAFKSLFLTLTQELVDGKGLDLEGLIDVLTLKDNYERVGDAAIALDRLVRDKDLPEGRKQVALLSIWRRVYIRDNWAEIANTAGRSEQAQRAKVRATLTYQTIRAVNDIKDFPRNFILSPHTSSQPPLPAEIAARFPTYPAEDVARLMADHEKEIELLNKYLEENGLEERVREVAEMVRKDLEEEEEEERRRDDDVVM